MIRILIVEDEKAISDLIRLNLMKAGYQCVCVYNGMKAADLLETENFDLIILDDYRFIALACVFYAAGIKWL